MRRNKCHKHWGACDLLPLRAQFVNWICLQHHCALAAFRESKGTSEQLCILAHTTYMAFLMGRAEHGRNVDLEFYREAETILEQSLNRARVGRGWGFAPEEVPHIAVLLTHYDAQVVSCRTRTYKDAMAALDRAEAKGRPPLSRHDEPHSGSALFAWLRQPFDLQRSPVVRGEMSGPAPNCEFQDIHLPELG